MKNITVDDFEQWRVEARVLLNEQVDPSHVNWAAGEQTQLDFTSSSHKLIDPLKSGHIASMTVPAHFLKMARAAACYRDDARWSLLYRVLWRLNQGETHLLQISTDSDVRKLKHMYQAVGRDVHKMHAFVRFQLKHVNDVPWYVSWFEPSHLIVAYTADFFVNRFNTMNWSILTPNGCAHWDQKKLEITSGYSKGEALALMPDQHNGDDMDDYWRQYYRHIFNPARLKTQAMQSEMPKKYWDNLPEAELIRELSQQSGKRTVSMLNKKRTAADRLRNKSKKLRQQQDAIRQKNQ